MTLLPCPPADIKVYRGVAVEDPGADDVCCHPHCEVRWGLETHHIVRRSDTGGPVRWVVIRGVVLLNERKVCPKHHLELTGGVGGHRGWIRYLEGEGWVWYAPAPLGSPAPLASAVVSKTGAVWLPVGALKRR